LTVNILKGAKPSDSDLSADQNCVWTSRPQRRLNQGTAWAARGSLTRRSRRQRLRSVRNRNAAQALPFV